MNNRLIQTIAAVRCAKKKLFCAYLTLGFPNLALTRTLIPILEKAGTDILELGFPFSDPLADGPTIQFASDRALKNHVSIRDAFRLVQELRKKGVRFPVLFFSYVNPILNHGVKRLARDLKSSGFDGLIIPDLSIEEGKSFERIFKRAGLCLVYLIAPTTRPARMKQIASRSEGFIYYVSLRGVTGARRFVSQDLAGNVRILKRISRKPVLVGFGVSRPEQVRQIGRLADGVIVGSAIVDQIRKSSKPPAAVKRLVSGLVRAVQS